MAGSRCRGTRLNRRRQFGVALTCVVTGFAGWAAVSAWRSAAHIGADALHALWLLPALLGLNLFQLWLSAQAWRGLLSPGSCRPDLFPLRVVREGIDSLLPVAQVGGEAVGAQLLARHGPTLATAAASVVVDMTLEFLAQLTFLLIGLATLAAISTEQEWGGWLAMAGLIAVGLTGLLAAQRFGALRLIEALGRRVAARWPAAAALSGLKDAADAIYYRTGTLLRGSGLHLVAWLLGTVETWAVLHALGWPVSLPVSLVVESLGMAARSAGFAVPGALVVQETGFALAAAAAGLPQESGLSLSLVKRVREVAIGLIGLMLWRLQVIRGRRQAVAAR